MPCFVLCGIISVDTFYFLQTGNMQLCQSNRKNQSGKQIIRISGKECLHSQTSVILFALLANRPQTVHTSLDSHLSVSTNRMEEICLFLKYLGRKQILWKQLNNWTQFYLLYKMYSVQNSMTSGTENKKLRGKKTFSEITLIYLLMNEKTRSNTLQNNV